MLGREESGGRRKVAVYCRVSTDKEDQVNSFEQQKKYFKEYIERRTDWELYQIFADEGISGTNTKKRKAFNQMIACARQGEIDFIITKEISRFARNTLDSISYTRELKKQGVGVIFVNDNINTLDEDAELRLTIMSSIAQEESRRISQRVKWGQKRSMEQGVVFGRHMLGYDVHNGKMSINNEGAEVVRLIFHKFVNERKGTHVIARELEEQGIKPMRVKEWANSVILKIIKNEKYCGDLVQRKTFTPDYLSHEKHYNKGEEELIIIKDHHEPIISREMFEQAGNILKERSLSQKNQSKFSRCYCFSGKIKCGVCNKNFTARLRVRKDGSKYLTWRCQNGVKYGKIHKDDQKPGCPLPSMQNEDFLQMMQLTCGNIEIDSKKILSNLTSIIKMVLSEENEFKSMGEIQKDLSKIEGKRLRVTELYLDKDIGYEEFIQYRSKYDGEVQKLKEQINSISLINDEVTLLKDTIEEVSKILNSETRDDVLYETILEKIVVINARYTEVYLKELPLKWTYCSS